MTKMRRRVFAAGSAAFAFAPSIAGAQKKYDPGVTDKEIKLGQTIAYSGPASAYGQHRQG
jgi:branched-chain amino acid transport system substrate-binding protein